MVLLLSLWYGVALPQWYIFLNF